MRINLVTDANPAVTADAASRRITGRLLPFDVAATPSVGPRVMFASDGEHVPLEDLWLNREHADSEVLGRAVDVTSTDDGLHAAFQILETGAGSDALVEAVDTDRADAIDRVQVALQPFGASTLFAAELRLNGRSSEQVWALLADYDVEVAY